MIAIGLVILVVFAFLRDVRSTLVPIVAVPVSLVGTLGVMYLLGFSLDNLSLMALTVATGFVVDDAIVVLENISRHTAAGMRRMQAAIKGAREVGFTVLSMSLSLIAVFIPILLMGGIVGRLFREFAVTLSAAILISLAISLTTTPMMCSILLRRRGRPRAWPALPLQRARLRRHAGRLPPVALLGAGQSAADHGGAAGDALPQRLSLCHHSQGLLPAAGHRTADRLDPGRPGDLLPADVAEAQPVRRHRQEGSRPSTPLSASPAAARPIPASCSCR